MKRIALLGVLFGICAFALADAAGDSVERGQTAAQAWLTLTDAGKYPESWDASAALFRSAVSKSDWEKAITDARGPLGPVKSRKLKSATFTKSIPGAPEGEYVIVQYDTEFEKKPAAVETLTAVHEKDGSWKVGGYYIR